MTVVNCDTGHDGGEVPAVFRVSFPSGVGDACAACGECMDIVLDNLAGDGGEVVVAAIADVTP